MFASNHDAYQAMMQQQQYEKELSMNQAIPQQPMPQQIAQHVPYPHAMPQNMPHQMSNGHYAIQPAMHPAEMQAMAQQPLPFTHPPYSVYNGASAHFPPQSQHFRRDSMGYEGSPAPDDSNNENKRKKGTPSTLANDQELRRALQQHEGQTLQELALKVQQTEGQNGGRAEKAKQVFAMVW
jgi:hypothetical protein